MNLTPMNSILLFLVKLKTSYSVSKQVIKQTCHFFGHNNVETELNHFGNEVYSFCITLQRSRLHSEYSQKDLQNNRQLGTP